MVEHVVKCPACTVGDLQILSDQIDIPHFGEVMISTLICSGCGYRSSDIVPLKNSSPKRFILKIDDPKKLNIRIVRSGSSTIRIPEIGAKIEPGLSSEGYVTNIEGILQKFHDILFQILRDLSTSSGSQDEMGKKSQVMGLIELLGNYINGIIPENKIITLILEDPLGNSAMIDDEGSDIITESLQDEEVAEILAIKQEKDVISDL